MILSELFFDIMKNILKREIIVFCYVIYDLILGKRYFEIIECVEYKNSLLELFWM